MEKRLILYYAFILTGAVLSGISGYITGKKKGFPKNPLKSFVIMALVFGVAGAMAMGQLQNFIMSLTGLDFAVSRMRIFGGLLFTPLLIYFPVKYLSGDYPLFADIIAPGAFLILGFSKIGCAVYGCCYGIACVPGVATPFEEHTVFPVQLLESLLCFILYGVLLYLVTKNKHRKGQAYPLALILYGTVRFMVEFLRYYPEAERALFLGMSFWQIVSIASVVLGGVWLICKRRV